jgi:hypothetical protein
VKSMKLEEARIGTRVRVDLDYRKAHLQGLVGTIEKHYGAPNYAAFEVLFPDGRTELFWDHQLEEVSPRPRRRWVFW